MEPLYVLFYCYQHVARSDLKVWPLRNETTPELQNILFPTGPNPPNLFYSICLCKWLLHPCWIEEPMRLTRAKEYIT